MHRKELGGVMLPSSFDFMLLLLAWVMNKNGYLYVIG
jgi:hypothetical protein